MWNEFVECDGALHRIGKLPLIKGMNMFVGSQWFSIPKHVMNWLLHNPLSLQYMEYAKSIVVADENYFQTLLKNSPYCNDLINNNYVFVLFDKWEHDKSNDNNTNTNNKKHMNRIVNDKNISQTIDLTTNRDLRKCLYSDPDICGRSPTTLTLNYKKLLQISRAMYARKFDVNNHESIELINMIDKWILHNENNNSSNKGDEGKQIMIKQKAIKNETEEICMEVTDVSNAIRMKRCNPKSMKQWFTLGVLNYLIDWILNYDIYLSNLLKN